MTWKTPETAPRDRIILADLGYAWALYAIWNSYDNKWVAAMLEACPMEGGTRDAYFESEQFEDKDLLGWMEVPGFTVRSATLRQRINASIAKAKFKALSKAEQEKRASEAVKTISQFIK